MAVKYGRALEMQNNELTRRLAVAKADSTFMARDFLRELSLKDQILEMIRSDYETKIEILRDQIPRWYESPRLWLVPLIGVIVYATLQAVKISID